MKAAWLLAMCCAGCAAAPLYGNFLEGDQPSEQARVAEDAGQVLLVEKPGDGQRWKLQHPMADSFGEGLARELRRHGQKVVAHEAGDRPGDRALAYAIDRVSGTDDLMVRLVLEDVELARAYHMGTRGEVVPAGPWARVRRRP